MSTSPERQPVTVALLLALSPWASRSAPLAEHVIGALAEAGVTEGIAMLPPTAEATSLWDVWLRVSGRWLVSHEPSVIEGIAATLRLHKRPEAIERILIHDAAWPLATGALMRAVCERASETGAAMAVGAVKETIKRLRDGLVVGTLPRERLALGQWPIALRRDTAERVVALGSTAGAEARLPALLAATGLSLSAVPGPPENTAITSAADLAAAEALLRRA